MPEAKNQKKFEAKYKDFKPTHMSLEVFFQILASIGIIIDETSLETKVPTEYIGRITSNRDLRIATQNDKIYKGFEIQKLEIRENVKARNETEENKKKEILGNIGYTQKEILNNPTQVFNDEMNTSFGPRLVREAALDTVSQIRQAKLNKKYEKYAKHNAGSKSASFAPIRGFHKWRAEKLARKIVRLQNKQGRLLLKQTEILCKDADKYINKKINSFGWVQVGSNIRNVRDAVREGVDQRMNPDETERGR